jgi:hypothetical protein
MADKTDLSLTGQVDPSDKNYYLVKISKLQTDVLYTAKFQWSFQDQVLNDKVQSLWSNGFQFTTIKLPTLLPPKFLNTDLSYFNGVLIITWNGLDSAGNPYTKAFDRINVYVKDETVIGGVYRLVGSLKSAGTVRVAVPPRAHSVKLTVVDAEGLESDFSVSQFETPKLTPSTLPTNVVGSWVGTDFKVSFDHNPAEEFFSSYKVKLTAGGSSKVFDVKATPGLTSQSFTLSLSQNRAVFGVPQTAISGSVSVVNIYGNESAEVAFSSSSYINTLPAATIVATAISNGYSVSYTTPADTTFNKIEVEEVESAGSTAPTTGYTKVFSGSSNPAIVIVPNTNKRWLRARFIDNIGSYGSYGTSVSVTPTNPVVADTEGPANVASVTADGGLDSTGTVGFNGYANISWPAVTGGGIRGYRIRFRPITDPVSSYSYADSPGTGTSYRLAGLGAGLTYEIAVATYDEYNNTSSSYVSSTANVVVGGTPYIASTVDVTGFFKAKANSTDADSTAFKFGYGVDTGKRGLVFNANNYWYIDSNQTATLKVGGATTNYIQWDGASFIIDGDLRAKKGSFSGNINMASGASVYSGTIGGNTVTSTGDTGGSLTSAGYILNSSGITFSNGLSGNALRQTTIAGATGLFTTNSANIGGWNVIPASISKTSSNGTLTLDSDTAQITATSATYTAGIATPNTNAATDIVFWAGGTRSTDANFYVTANGTVTMKSAVITGYASGNDILGLAKTDMSNVTTIDGSKITTGQIKSSNHAVGTVAQLPFSGAGTLIDLSNGSIISPQFYLNGSTGAASFKGTLSAGIAIDTPTITSGTITGASVTVTASIISSGLPTASDSSLDEASDTNQDTTTSYVGAATFNPTLRLQDGKISSNTIMRIEGASYTEILSGGTQSAMFDSSRSAMYFTEGLYLGDPAKSSSANVQSTTSTRVPWISIDGTLRLRKGAPLKYPGGTTGAYVRNIYIKQTTSTPSTTTGHVGDIFITY